MYRFSKVSRSTSLIAMTFSLGYAEQVFAHGFGQRYDLPVPLWLYVTGAAAAVAFSFIIIGLFVRTTPDIRTYPRLNLLRFSAGRFFVHPLLCGMLKVISVGVFLLCIITGLIGNQNPMQNLTPTLVWIIWWVGLAYVSVLGGNLWTVINPWKIIFEGIETLYRRIQRKETPFAPLLPYPHVLGMWPAFLLLFAFAWIELVFEGRAVPANLALLMLIYSAMTWVGMFLFGKDQWLRHGEAFSQVFEVLARFAPTEVRVKTPEQCASCSLPCRDLDDECINCSTCFRYARKSDREWNLRPFAVGLLRNENISSSMMAFVILLLSTVTFDGFMATPIWANIESALYPLLSFFGSERFMVIQTGGLLAFFLLFIGIYLFFGEAMAFTSGGSRSGEELARSFTFTLVPIAIAYHLSHYLSFLLIQGQLIIPLASDPFGFGWNLLGTVGYRINIGIIGARFVWFTAVIAIVVGHILAVYLAHIIAMRTLQDRSLALRSQYPMLVLMVGYTMISLWILAQPIVETRGQPSRTTRSTAEVIQIPSDALFPEPGTGVFQTVGEGKTAKAKLIYRLLNSVFHDGTQMTVADLLYPYSFAAKWGTHTSPEDEYDPYIARSTALLRRWLVGVKVFTVEKSLRGFGEMRLNQEIPVIEVYSNYPGRDPQQAAALAPPWSSLPWHLLVLMEETVKRGWAAFSQEEARRRGVPWLDLVRDQVMKNRLAALVEEFTHQAYIPEVLKDFVTAEEARTRWSALQKFAKLGDHFLVTNGPYIMNKWAAEYAVLQAFRDLSYPLGVGAFDKYAIPRRAYITKIELRDNRVEIAAEVEKIEKFQRSYTLIREPLQGQSSQRNLEVPVCRYVVVGPDAQVVKAGSGRYTDTGLFFIDLKEQFPPGLYTILITLYLSENYTNPDIRMISYRVDGGS